MTPVLGCLVEKTKKEVPNLERVLFVAVQHLLYTTLNIFESLILLGANPRNIFLIGKQYSTCPHVANKALAMGIQVQPLTPLQKLGTYQEIITQDILNMWKNVGIRLNTSLSPIETIVVLDDGGRCITAIPDDISKSYSVICVEQTTAGIKHFEATGFRSPYPYIDVASCAAKSLEADMVAKVIVDKVADKLSRCRHNITCGVVGLGFIGAAIAKGLMSLGHKILLFDSKDQVNKNIDRFSEPNNFSDEQIVNIRKNSRSNNQIVSENLKCNFSLNKMEWVNTAEELIKKSNFIFGCTGNDFTKNLEMNKILQNNKYFISCTSEDKEFLSILKHIQYQGIKKWHPLGNIHWRVSKTDIIHIINGGFPVNFDQSGISVPEEDIQLTRALILGAILQAILVLPSYRRNAIRERIMLDPSMQGFIVSKWRELRQINVQGFEDPFANLAWIIQNSGGLFHKLAEFSTLFDIKRDMEPLHSCSRE